MLKMALMLSRKDYKQNSVFKEKRPDPPHYIQVFMLIKKCLYAGTVAYKVKAKLK